MKLNPDCIRKILMTIEDKSSFREKVRIPCKDAPLLKEFSEDQILYHTRQCWLAGYFYKVDDDFPNVYLITDLSPQGHALVGKIRDESNWGVVQRGLSAVRGYSLDVIKSIAEGAVSAAVTSFLGNLPSSSS